MNWLQRLSNTLFHGTDSLQNIKDYEMGRGGLNDYGLFGLVKTTRHAIFLTDNMDFAKEYGRVMHIKADLKNTANIDNDLMYEFINSIDPWQERDLWIQAKYVKHVWQLFDGEVGGRFVKWLKGKGYDSATFYEEVPVKDSNSMVSGNTTVVFDASLLQEVSS